MDIFGIFFKPVVFLSVLGVLVAVHELGHFLAAKFFRVGVLEFAIGFGKKLFSKKIGETKYSLRMIPLGGFVKMVGDDPFLIHGNPDENPNILEKDEERDPEELELMADKSRWFLLKGYIPKVIIVLAGPLFNFFFAIILAATATFMYGRIEFEDVPRIGDVKKGFPAEEVGLESGDFVKSVDGFEPKTWTQLAAKIGKYRGKEMELVVERTASDNTTKTLTFNIATKLDDSEIAKLIDGDNKKFRIGVSAPKVTKSATLGESIASGFDLTFGMTYMIYKQFASMFQGNVSMDSLRGPVFIYDEAGNQAKEGFDSLLYFMMALSISLAVMNLLPIPVLDGGHILMFTIELLTFSKLSFKTQQIATQVGMIFILGLMIFVIGNDFLHLFGAY